MKENNEQLYIARCTVDEKFKRDRCLNFEHCICSKPHKWNNDVCIMFPATKCSCMPLPFEYYIEEILNERK